MWQTEAKVAQNIGERKKLTSMNRKRFVKYLMGQGLPRNKAKKLASFITESKMPYRCFRVSEITKRKNGMYTGILLAPAGFAQNNNLVITPKDDIALYGSTFEIQQAFPIKSLRLGWQETELKQWARREPLKLQFPTEAPGGNLWHFAP